MTAAAPASPLNAALAYARRNKVIALCAAVVALSFFLMVFGASLAPYPPEQTIQGAVLLPPSARHWFGTDRVGFDIFSRVIAAPRIDLYIALLSTILALAIGVPLGVIAGFVGDERGLAALLSEWAMRALDVVQSFPVFILALALVAALGSSENNIVIVLVILQAPVFLRLTRSAAMAVKHRSFIMAARCSGAPTIAILLRHIFPNSLSPALIASSVAIGQAILITAGLSFIGAGVEVTKPEWGAMIAQGAPSMITGQWWPSLFPGVALAITVYAYSVMGEVVRVFLDGGNRE